MDAEHPEEEAVAIAAQAVAARAAKPGAKRRGRPPKNAPKPRDEEKENAVAAAAAGFSLKSLLSTVGSRKDKAAAEVDAAGDKKKRRLGNTASIRDVASSPSGMMH